MNFSYSRERTIEEIKKWVQIKNVRIENGKLYIGDEAHTSTNMARACSFLFMLEDKKYLEIANYAIENDDHVMSHMTPMFLSRIYLNHFDKLSNKAKKSIAEYLKKIKTNYTGDEMDFVGVNDNFPFMSTYTAVAMYKILGDEDMLGEAKRRFNQMEMLLKRRGVISEYMSGYTTFQLFIVAALEKIAPDNRCRDIALKVQTRIWMDFFAHYNENLGTFCGPYSRRYLEVNETEEQQRYINRLFDVPVKLEGWDDDMPSFYLLEEFTCSDDVMTLLNGKSYPFEFKACAECSASTDSTPECEARRLEEDEETYEYPAGEEKLYTYMTEEYAVGTATKEWHSGIQTSSFMVSYKSCVGVPRVESDIRTIDCRYLINDEQVADQRFFEQGRKMAFGNKNRALVLYKPKIAIIPPKRFFDEGDSLTAHYRRQEITGNLNCTSAKLVILIPIKGKQPDKILVNNKSVENCTALFDKPYPIYIKDGNVYLAFHPLTVTDKGRNAAMTIGKRKSYLEIALYNYEGEARNFARRDFLHIQNGFGFAISSKSECGNFERFTEAENKTIITDRLITTTHSRQTYVRHVDMETANMKLSCEISPASEGIKYFTCNDYPIEIPKLYISGFDMKKLPYME